ncbi:MAG: choice-of-anchor D domain-containing protein, partial [Deltaproteobacteria bacterium]|nr:choice-of-anchor D domain-containing protein [Deltaproteobacteria bacterium]
SNNGGVSTSSVMVALTGSDLGQFSLGTDTCSGAPLAAAATCTVVVRFAPSSQGSFAAGLSISATDGGTAIASLTGTGVLPAILNVAPSGMFVFPSTYVGEAATVTATFNVDNTGGVDSGPLSVVLADTVNYSLTSNTCTGVLAPAGMCAFTVRFAPTAAGARNSTVTVSATPGGSRQVVLEGSGADPLGWTGNATFAGTLPAASSENVFVLRNDGSVSSGALAITITGANAGDFVRQAPGAGECVDGTALVAAASCMVRVRFSASAPGARSAMLQATASPGGTPMLALTGTGLRSAILDGSPGPTYMFSSPQGVGTSSSPRAWTVTNSGDENTGAMTITTGGDLADFPFTTTCNSGSVINAHSSCGFDISFRPTALGTRTATFQVSAGPGGTALLTVSGTGQPTLSVSVVGGGTGLVTSSPAGISCPPTCAAGFPLNATVQLRARTANGANAFFRGWGAGDCSGSFQDCNLTMSQGRSAIAQIAPITHNLAFVSSTALAANLGGVAAYDAQCNALASAAGINNFDAPGGSAYVAWMSDSVTAAPSRLASARGFVRRDGVPFGDDQGSLLSQARVLGALSLDETGRDVGNREVMTGTDNFGSAVVGGTCSNWASSSVTESVTLGASHGGPLAWSQSGSGTCDVARPIYCLMRNRNAAVNPPTLTGTRRVWVSSGYTPGVTTPDAHCDGDKPAGVASARAMIATTTVLASSVVTLATTYVRPDGHVVGSGAQLASEATLQSGIWQTSSGSYFATGGETWTGSQGSPGVLATLAGSCEDWTRADTGIGRRGNLRLVSSWFQGDASAPCDAGGATVRLYCVEQ